MRIRKSKKKGGNKGKGTIATAYFSIFWVKSKYVWMWFCQWFRFKFGYSDWFIGAWDLLIANDWDILVNA